jgi:hypothetical protein
VVGFSVSSVESLCPVSTLLVLLFALLGGMLFDISLQISDTKLAESCGSKGTSCIVKLHSKCG